ncbi:MAG: MmgE/PrpD family protein [Steroidobacteraceae bacterium]
MLNPAALEVGLPTNTASLVVALAEYAAGFAIESSSAIRAARHCFIDALANGLEALHEPECAALIGPLVPGCLMPGGARVPGTSLELDPAQAAFCTTLMFCRQASPGNWLTSGGAFGALLAVADYQGRKAIMEGTPPPKVRDVLAAMIKAVEIEGVLAVDGTTVRLARLAITSVVTAQLGGALGQIVTALSYACTHGGMQINTDERCDIDCKDWARADAISHAVRHACQAVAAGSSYLTQVDALDIADKRLGAKSWRPHMSFGTVIIDQLAAARRPMAVAELTMRFHAAVDRHFPLRHTERIKALFAAPERLDELPVNELLAALVTNGAL